MMDEKSRQAASENLEPPVAETATDNGPPAADAAALAAELEELRDKYLRAVAELDNVRKRAEREVADARSFGIAVFARDVISVADNLARALGAVEPHARAAAEGPFRALLDGLELTDREMQATLQKHGIRPVNPKGEKFDPHLHQAMLEVAAPEAPAGTVVEVMQVGYAIGDRILRPALVAVAKGQPRPENGPIGWEAGNPSD